MVDGIAWDELAILITEDDDGLREVLGEYFVERGSKVLFAANGEEAFETLSHQHVDLLISDVRMPKLDGVGLLQKIRSSGIEFPPTLMVTGHSDVKRDAFLRLGALDLLCKPFNLVALDEKVELALASHRRQTSDQFHSAAPI